MSTLSTLLRGGLRLSFLRTPRQVPVQVGIAPALALIALVEALRLPGVWAETGAPHTLAVDGIASPLITVAVLLLASAALARLAQRPSLHLTIFAWLAAAGAIPTLFDTLLRCTLRGGTHAEALWWLGMGWWGAITLRLAWFLAPNAGRALAGAAGASAIGLFAGLAVDAPSLVQTDWLAHYESREESDHDAARLASELEDPEGTIYAQPALLDLALRRLAPQRPGKIDLFLVGFAADADEGAFRNEVDFLPALAAHRLDAEDRALRLVNHPGSADELPLATVTNLERALEGVAGRMDVDEDILFLYLSSHGSEDPELYVNQPPLPLDQLDPLRLRDALDDAGIRWRVIVISACYSGGFIDALRDPRTLVITAARADRTSFGCGNSANATWFGNAFLVDGLNHSANFRRAFLRARRQIAEREKAEDYEASEPQWAAGDAINAHLTHWLDALPEGKTAEFVPSVRVVPAADTPSPSPATADTEPLPE